MYNLPNNTIKKNQNSALALNKFVIKKQTHSILRRNCIILGCASRHKVGGPAAIKSSYLKIKQV